MKTRILLIVLLQTIAACAIGANGEPTQTATETFLSEYDLKTNLTILSGDIDGDDINIDVNNINE